jgi:hypothetical protein
VRHQNGSKQTDRNSKYQLKLPPRETPSNNAILINNAILTRQASLLATTRFHRLTKDCTHMRASGQHPNSVSISWQLVLLRTTLATCQLTHKHSLDTVQIIVHAAI